MMKLRYDNKDINLVECKSFYTRFKGFMLEDKIDKALLFDKCNSVHTFFMKKNIDIIMCDKDDTVLYIYNDVNKNKIIWPKKRVTKVYELPVNYFDYKLNTKFEVIK